MSLLEVIGLRKARETEWSRDFDTLAGRLADGKKVDPNEIDAILTRSGRGVEELQSVVDRITERRRLVDLLEGEKGDHAAVRELEAKYKSVEAAGWKAEQAYKNELRVIADTKVRLVSELHKYEVARTRLHELRDPATIAADRTVSERRGAAARRLQENEIRLRALNGTRSDAVSCSIPGKHPAECEREIEEDRKILAEVWPGGKP